MSPKAGKNSIKTTIKGDSVRNPVAPLPMSKRPGGMQQPLPDKVIEPGNLINRQNHPVTLTYDGQGLVIAPRGRVFIPNRQKLSKLSAGVVFVPAPAAGLKK